LFQPQYATANELISFSLTQELVNNIGISVADMNTALQAASSEADSWLRSQQILPLTDWDAKLKQVVCDIAAFRIFGNYGYNPDAVQNSNIISRYSHAMEWLKLVADQKIITEYPDSSNLFPKAGPFVVDSRSPVGFANLCRSRFRRGF
jgi:phage gp36-like protein